MQDQVAESDTNTPLQVHKIQNSMSQKITHHSLSVNNEHNYCAALPPAPTCHYSQYQPTPPYPLSQPSPPYPLSQPSPPYPLSQPSPQYPSSQPCPLSPASFVCVPSTPLLTEEVSEPTVYYVEEVVDDEDTNEPIQPSSSVPSTLHLTHEVSEPTVYYVQEEIHDDEDTNEPTPILIDEIPEPVVYYYYEDNHEHIPPYNSFDDVERTRDFSKPRRIYVTIDNYQNIIDYLSADIAILESTQPDSKLEIDLNLHSRTLISLGSEQRTAIIQKFLSLFGKHIIGLSLVIYDDDVYLLQQQYHLPKLRSLMVKRPPRPGNPRRNVAFDGSTRILEDLLIIYGRVLKVLEVTGVWNIEISDTKYIPVPALETLYLTRSMSCSLHRLIIISGNYITTLEIYDITGQKASGEDCYMTHLKHLRIDCKYSLKYFQFVRSNAERLESLMISCGLYEEDFYPRDLSEFRNLKLLEVNFPLMGTAILLRSSQTLEYLYIPQWKEPLEELNWWLESKMNMPVYLPKLKDLCVLGNKRWSIDVIKNNWRSLEFLVIFGYNEQIELSSDDDSDDSDKNFDDDGNYIGEDKTIWQDLSNIECRFPNLKMLLLPDCYSDSTIVENLFSRCPANVQVLTDRYECGEAVKARIQQSYTYKRYTRMMHSQLFELFDLEEEPSLEEFKDDEIDGSDESVASDDSDGSDDSDASDDAGETDEDWNHMYQEDSDSSDEY